MRRSPFRIGPLSQFACYLLVIPGLAWGVVTLFVVGTVFGQGGVPRPSEIAGIGLFGGGGWIVYRFAGQMLDRGLTPRVRDRMREVRSGDSSPPAVKGPPPLP